MEIIGEGLKAFLQTCEENIIPPFKQKFPWLGPDLQTVRNSLMKEKPQANLDRRLYAELANGEKLTLAVTEPTAANVDKSILLIHGLGGAEDSHYMHETAKFYAAKGWATYRYNARGVGPSRETSSPPYSAGLTDDLRTAMRAILVDTNNMPLYCMGFSLGGQLLLRTLGEGRLPCGVAAGVSVSAPLDLAASQRKLERRRNGVYVDYLVKNMRADLEGTKAPCSDVGLEEITTIRGFDEHIIGPYFGFSGADEYYGAISCKSVITKIETPFLAIHSADDPWIPAEDYVNALWPEGLPVGAALLPRGGHVGFHCGYEGQPWFLKASYNFFKTV